MTYILVQWLLTYHQLLKRVEAISRDILDQIIAEQKLPQLNHVGSCVPIDKHFRK